MITLYGNQVVQSSWCNSYHSHRIYSETDRVKHIRCYWKHNIVDPSSHHFCINGQGGAIEYKFPSMGRLQIHNSTHSLDSHSETLPMSLPFIKVRLHYLLACASCALAALHTMLTHSHNPGHLDTCHHYMCSHHTCHLDTHHGCNVYHRCCLT